MAVDVERARRRLRTSVRGWAVVLGVLLLAFAGSAEARAQARAEQDPATLATPPVRRVGLDRVWVRGTAEPLRGRVLERNAGGCRFVLEGTSSPVFLRADQIVRIELAPSPAEVYRRRAAALAPGDAGAHLALARSCLAWGLVEQAIVELRAAIAADAGSAAAYRLLVETLQGRLAAARGRRERLRWRERLLEVYEAAAQAGLHEAPLVLGYVRLLEEIGARRLAIARLEQALAGSTARAPSATAQPAGEPLGEGLRARYRLELARLQIAAGRLSEAEQVLRPLVTERAQEQVRARAWRALGLAALARADGVAAREAFAKARAAGDGGVWLAVFEAQAALCRGEGEAALERLDAEQALRAAGAQTVSASSDVRAEAAIVRALALALAGRGVQARTVLEELAPAESAWTKEVEGAQTLALFHARVALVRAFVEARMGEIEGALERLEQVQVRQPWLAGLAALVRAYGLEQRGALAEANEALIEAARYGYDFGVVALRLMDVELARGRYDEALRYGRYAVNLRADDPAVWSAYGFAWLEVADRAAAGTPEREAALQSAAQAFERALAIDPQAEAAARARMYLAYRGGAFDEAAERARNWLRTHGDDPYAREIVTRIERARSRRVWRDRFARPDADTVRNRWLEDEAYGVQLRLHGGKLVVSGEQTNAAWGRTRLVRELERDGLVEFRVRWRVRRLEAGRFGIEVRLRDGAALALAREENGALAVRWRASERRGWSEPERIGDWPADDSAHTLAIEFDRAAEQVVLRLDARELERVRKRRYVDSQPVRCELWVEAALGERVELEIEEAALFVERGDE